MESTWGFILDINFFFCFGLDGLILGVIKQGINWTKGAIMEEGRPREEYKKLDGELDPGFIK